MTAPRGLLDTSVYIATESGRGLDESNLPDEGALSVVTLAELRAGVLAAVDTGVRARRLATLEAASTVKAFGIDAAVAGEWARLRVHLAETGRRVGVNDLWIAATAVAHRLPVVSQDGDFDALVGAEGFTLIRV
ncbi:type II toxin-antitoxin system VapC family toxin [Quadrisphaera sp. DSM 44207]|uniref:type II toxin-antitoxin system VapC family toxin n=1 Tax=Quadrisphaera sp. DSM 44207 TaxID=1881057 RepID=UPI000885615C|nr:type II toxin-antitoxin system VapC family toxin [Quadrisphaera sp. DSM 44207]SDQ35206.1 hypothetical protein SAMN05428996_1361 [Quadrisphaera sp. DSM 44207]